jgi:hypothetical protein
MFSLAVLLLLLTLNPVPVHAAQEANIGGLSPAEALAAGERMYREGILPNGEPMQAFVQEDIPVDGTMFTCQNCHLRSGLGTAEGTIITLPTNGSKLYRPLHQGAEIEVTPSKEKLGNPFQSLDIRPAYTDKTLARAIGTGTTPNDRELNWTMPRYALDAREMEILTYFLKSLSKDYSPGVTADSLKFATVITDEVPKHQQQAMLLALQAYLRDHNSQSRHEGRRAKHGPFYKQDRYTAFREFELKVWRLSGPPETWGAQLQTYYQQDPVFALLGGISTLDWTPIEQFCESFRIPSLLPVTDHPGQGTDNWYTLYLSRGPGQEGEAAAHYLRSGDTNPTEGLLQVVSDHPDAQAMAEAFTATWTGSGGTAPTTMLLPANQEEHPRFWEEVMTSARDKTLVVWVPGDQLQGLSTLSPEKGRPERLILSYTLTRDFLKTVATDLQPKTYLTYPNRLPEDLAGRYQFVRKWLEVRGIPATDLEIQSQMFFLGWLMTGVTRMMGDDFYRDYFLDVVDMMNDETYAVAKVPRVSFGPGQRYASKGCYIVQLGADGTLKPMTPWVIH